MTGRPSNASPPWVDLLDTVTGLGNSFLFGESCPANTSTGVVAGCFLLGDSQTTGVSATGGEGQVLYAPVSAGKGTLAGPWKVVHAQPGVPLTDISCVDTGAGAGRNARCFAVGASGTILYCPVAGLICDGNAGWGQVTPADVATTNTLFGVSCNSFGCVAVGDNQTVVANPAPGGPMATSPWTLVHAPAPGAFLGVVCHALPASDVCYAGGGNSVTIGPVTTVTPLLTRGPVAGGVAWTDTATLSIGMTNGWVNGLACDNRNQADGLSPANPCYAATDDRVLTTVDGGSTWSRLGNAPGALGIACAGSTTGCATAGYRGQVFHEASDNTVWTPESIGANTELDFIRCSNNAGAPGADFCHAGGLDGMYGRSTGDTSQALDAYATAVLADNPLVYYRLNEPSGPNAYDLAGSPPGAFLTPQFFSLHAAGPHLINTTGALQLLPNATTGGSVNTTAVAFLGSPEQDFTVEFWVNLPGVGNADDVVLGGTTPGSAAIDFNLGHLNLRKAGGSIYVPGLTADNELGGAWRHYVVLRRGVCGGAGQPAYNVAIWRDDSQIGRACSMDGFAWNAIGKDGDPAKFNGALADVAVYGTALSQPRIEAHYAADGHTVPNVVEFFAARNRPWGIVRNPVDGAIWYGQQGRPTETNAHVVKLGLDGTFTEYDLGAFKSGLVAPTVWGLAVDGAGDIWVADGGRQSVQLVSHTTGAVLHEWPLAQFGGLTLAVGGGDNQVYESAGGTRRVDIVDPGTGVETSVTDPNLSATLQFDVIGPDGNVWVTDSHGSLGRVLTTAGHAFTSFVTAATTPIPIASGIDGVHVYFGNTSGGLGTVGAFDTTQTANPPVLTNIGCFPSGLTFASDSHLWAVCADGEVKDTQTFRLAGTIATPANSTMMAANGNYVWIPENATDRIARVKIN